VRVGPPVALRVVAHPALALVLQPGFVEACHAMILPIETKRRG
jgi:hypothetical protein